jgi:hypothetical protein
MENRTRKFAAYAESFRQKLNEPDSEQLKSDLSEIDKELRSKTLTPGAVTRTQLLENLAVAYANEEFIGDILAPKVFIDPAMGLSPEYWIYSKKNKMAYPSDEVGTDGVVNIVSEGVTRTSTALTRRALKELSDSWVTSMMDPIVSRLINPMMNVLHGLAFQQEVRAAALLGTATAYGSNTTALSGADVWSSSGGGDPAGAVDTAKDSIWSGTGPTKLVAFASPAVHKVLKRHPQILDSIKYGGNGSSPVLATKQAIADFFEVDQYVVGAARKTVTNEGQTTQVYSRMWPDVFGIVRAAAAPSTQMASFAVTLQQPLQSESWYVNGTGGRGGFWVQGSLADKALCICSDCGFLLTGVI